MELIKIEKDNERAKSLFLLSMMRFKKIDSFNLGKESSLIAESYYEICKELITSILFLEGYKTLSHKDLVEYVKSNYEFSETEIEVLDMLRKRRNKIVYYGIFVDIEYITRNKLIFEEIIGKLKKIVKDRLK